MHQQKTAFENIVGKGEIARNEFLLSQIIVSPSVHIFDIISLFASELDKPKIGISAIGSNSSYFFTTLHSFCQEAFADYKLIISINILTNSLIKFFQVLFQSLKISPL